jgi:hypothetical protein
VTLRGDFAREHKEEMIRLARHQKEAEKKEHPLDRIISIEDDVQGIVINTTDIHPPRRIGDAVKRAFHGEIEDNFEKDGYFVRVIWTRETWSGLPFSRAQERGSRRTGIPPDEPAAVRLSRVGSGPGA